MGGFLAGSVWRLAFLFQDAVQTTTSGAEAAATEGAVPEQAAAAAQTLPQHRTFWTELDRIWNYPITNVDGQPITPGTLVIGLTFFAIGIALSRFVSGIIRTRVVSRFKLGEGPEAVVQSLLFYLLAIVFTVLAFQFANVPLTAFTLLGGALAIGVGFGSQNIINNFISGLILLLERPISVGDLVQVDDLYGRVERIGPRSTRIRTGENLEIVVPNSSFLEQNVINWSLSGSRVRVRVVVGVAYGSDTKRVADLMLEAVKRTKRAHETPEPIVIFAEFGDNSLNFEVHFWIDMRAVMDRKKAESDVRYEIDALFREADVVIAFPQRDVHLDATRPIPVVVTDSRG